MNILYHHRTQGKGVEGVHIRSIVKALRDLNHNVTVISPPGCNPTQEKPTTSANGLKPLKVFFSVISRSCPEFIFECLELVYNIPAFFRISNTLKQNKIDLINERYFLFSLASIFIAKRFKIPIIYEVNDSSFVPRLRELKFVRIANYIEKKVFSKADHVITVSNYFKNILVKAGIPADKITVCHNAVDPDIFDPSNIKDVPLAIPSDRLVLGFVGLFVKWVGIESLIRVFHRVQPEYPKIHLLLVGSGPEEENLRKSITDLGLKSHVTITGTIIHSEVPSYIRKMDICIIPKHENYTSPVKLFEYMAMGKPVLVPANESIKEVIEHGKNGMLFDPDSDDDFFTVLTQMIENKKLLQSLGTNARRDVLNKYTWRKNVLQIEKQANRIRLDLC